jgi:hypothetical protein
MTCLALISLAVADMTTAAGIDNMKTKQKIWAGKKF